MTTGKSGFGKPDLTAALRVMERGDSEKPLSEAPPVAGSPQEAIAPKAGEGATPNSAPSQPALDNETTEPTVSFTFRLPESLANFMLEETARESIRRKKRASAGKLYEAAVLNFARSRGYKPPGEL